MEELIRQEPEGLSLEDIFDIAWRRKWSFLLPAFLLTFIGAAAALLLPPTYKSSSTILIEEQEIPQNFVMATVTSYAEQRLQLINQQIMSTTRLLQIIKEFNLYEDLMDRWTTDEIIEQMREDIKMATISAEVMDRRTGRAQAVTIAFTLTYEGKKAGQVQQVANKLTSLYLEENLKVRKRKTLETSLFLDEEARRVEKELRTIQNRISDFKEKHINELPEMMSVNLTTRSNLERQIEILNQQLRSLKEREGYLETQLAAIPKQQEFDKDALRMEELKVMLVNLRSRFTDEYPDVAKLKQEIANLEKKMTEAPPAPVVPAKHPDNPAYVTLSSQLASTRNDIRSVRNQKKEMEKMAAEYQARIEAGPGLEREYSAMILERESLVAKLNDLKRKAMEAKVAHGLEEEQKGERFTLIDPPRYPEKPFKPNRLVILLVGMVLGCGAGVGLAAIKEMTDHAVRKASDLSLATGFPVLGEIPEIITRRDLRSRRLKRLAVTFSLFLIFTSGVVFFHYKVMDLYVFKARVMRKLDKYQLLPGFISPPSHTSNASLD